MGPASAVVATAVFLWAPFTLIGPLSPSTVFLGPLLTAALWLLVLVFHRYRSAAALAGVGAVAGLAITYPALVPVTLLALIATGWSCYRGPRPPLVVVAVAVLSFLAAALPGVPGIEGARAMWRTYAAPSGRLAALQE